VLADDTQTTWMKYIIDMSTAHGCRKSSFWAGMAGGDLKSHEKGGLFSATTPKKAPLPAPTLWELHRNLPWQRKQPLLRWTFTKTEPGRAHTQMQTLSVNPAKAHLPLPLVAGFCRNVSRSSPFDPQNVHCLPCTGPPCQHSVRLTHTHYHISKRLNMDTYF